MDRGSRLKMQMLSAITILGLLQIGCTKLVAIKPTEILKLNGHTVQNLGHVKTSSADVRIVGVSVSQIEGEDGRTVEIAGRFNAHVETRAGDKSVFEAPVVADPVAEEGVRLRGSNRAAKDFMFADIKHLNVEVGDPVKTWLLYGGIVTAATAVLYFVVLRPKLQAK